MATVDSKTSERMTGNEDFHVDAPASGPAGCFGHVRELITDALRYWELRRVVYKSVVRVSCIARAVAVDSARGGVAFAAVLTHCFSTGIFGASAGG